MTERAFEQLISDQSNDPEVDADLRDRVELSSMSALIAVPISCEQTRLGAGQSVVLTIVTAGSRTARESSCCPVALPILKRGVRDGNGLALEDLRLRAAVRFVP